MNTPVTASTTDSTAHLPDPTALLRSMPPLIGVTRAASLLGISRSAAYRYAAAGHLPTRRLGGRVYVVTALLAELITSADEVAA